MKLPSPEAIHAYIAHTYDGTPMRHIATENGREPSTVLRQIRKVEELRDNPEWDAILTALEKRWDVGQSVPDRTKVFDALGVDLEASTKEMQLCLPKLIHDSGILAITEGAHPAIFVEGEVMRRTERQFVLSWIATGWLACTAKSARVRRYRITDVALAEVPDEPGQLPAIAPGYAPPPPKRTTKTSGYTRKPWGNEPINRLIQLSRRKSIDVPPELIFLAGDLRNLMRQAQLDGVGSSTLQLVTEVEKRLGKEMFDLLHDFLHLGHGFEQIEKDYSWPARSAKVVLVIALQQVQHFGIMEPQEPAVAAE